MNATMGRRMRRLRAACLSLAFCGFVIQFALLRHAAMPLWFSRGVFFAIDPLVLLQHFAETHTLLHYALFALIPLVLTFLLGRFFCGWVCPFGAIHEVITWIGGKRQKASSRPNRSFLSVKYLILTAIIVAALAGLPLAGWIDPFALLTRSTTAAIEPAVSNALWGAWGRVSVQPVLIGAIFLLVIFLNLWRRRFFCNSLCPLGALYGLIGRFSLLRFEATAECTQCRACTSRCTYNGGPSSEHLKSECDLCFACVADCSEGCVDIKCGPPSKPAARLDLGRRQLLGTAVVGLAAASFSRAGAQTVAQENVGHGFLRPPGAVGEKLFLSRCVRCGQCVEACPTNFIQPSLLEAGFIGLWTPVLNARTGYCVYDCNRCTKVCPSVAIKPLTLVQKKSFKMGTAKINRSRCLRYVEGGDCTVCIEKCPVPGKPLREEVPVPVLQGHAGTVRHVYVVADLCTGCGICEYFCPTGASRGITVESESQDREAVTIG
jgi:polyferredoxin/Pyruvate/2-oxoacid:ferredoxin oxidoreductase delta subunit